MMASTEDSAAAILPQEEEEEEREEEEDVKSKVQASDPAPEPHENGTVSESGRSEEIEGAETEQQGPGEPKAKEQLVVEEEDGDRDEQQQQQQQLGPRDEIKVTVTGYQRTADNCTFDVEVHASIDTNYHVFNKLSCMLCIHVIMLCAHFQVEVNNGRAKTVHRTYHDLLWLHRNLTRRVELGGYIVRIKLAKVCVKLATCVYTAYQHISCRSIHMSHSIAQDVQIWCF